MGGQPQVAAAEAASMASALVPQESIVSKKYVRDGSPSNINIPIRLKRQRIRLRHQLQLLPF